LPKLFIPIPVFKPLIIGPLLTPACRNRRRQGVRRKPPLDFLKILP